MTQNLEMKGDKKKKIDKFYKKKAFEIYVRKTQ